MDNRKIREMYLSLDLIIPENCRYITTWYETIESKLKPKIAKNLRIKIIANKICFVRFHSPAFNYINFKDLFGDFEHIIFLDVSKLREIYNDDVELIFPILLHEIGHLFNIPLHNGALEEVGWINESEYYADDFVRRLGFNTELIKSYEYYKNWKQQNGEEVFEIFEKKLKRLKDNVELKIGMDINEFNKYRKSPHK